MTINEKQWRNAIEHFTEDEADGCYWYNVEKLNDGRNLCLVFGYEEGYDKDDTLYQVVSQRGRLWTLCAKLAVNIDDLQCDYDMDWYMPWDKDGDVVDTDMAVTKNIDDIEWYNNKAKEIKEGLDNGTLEVH